MAALRIRCCQPRPQPSRKCADNCGCPSNDPLKRPCYYDCPCLADCFNHGPCTRPSGRYARTVRYPGECCPCMPPCPPCPCPNPPKPPNPPKNPSKVTWTYRRCNKHCGTKKVS